MKSTIEYLIFLCTTAAFMSTGYELQAQGAESKLVDLGIELPAVSPPIANYVKFRRSGHLLYISGHVPSIKGKIGHDLTTEQGYEAAKETAISILATINSALGDLDKVDYFVKIDGMVNCTDDFYDQSKVINGCSDLLVAIFGENGKHTRTAVGHNSLPGNYAVEISAVLAIKE